MTESLISGELGLNRIIGDRMPDGTIFAGLSPDTQKPMYVWVYPTPLTFTFNNAQKFAARLHACGHRDWRLPTTNELTALFRNRAAIGGFNESGGAIARGTTSRYWSSTPCDGRSMLIQDFKNGDWGYDDKFRALSLCCVRG